MGRSNLQGIGEGETLPRTPAAAKLVAVCIPTCRRPRMLQRCLSHVASMTVPKGVSVIIIVCDNDGGLDWDGLPVRPDVTCYEALRGITYARNALIELALRSNAGWIAFIDDDEWPERSWLATLLATQAETGADVVHGVKSWVRPVPLPFWSEEGAQEAPETLPSYQITSGRHVSGGNLLVASRLFKEWGLRFDHRFALTSGEDTDLFTRAERKGAMIVTSNRAVMFEEVVRERCTFIGQIARHHQYGAVATLIDKGEGKFASILPKAAVKLAAGIALLLLAPASALAGKSRFVRHALKGGKSIMYGTGRLSALAGFRRGHYRHIQGY